MNNSKPAVALIVHACDRYEFLFKGFEYFFQKYWDFNVNCKYYFATEKKEGNIKGFVNIQSGEGEWADRLKILLEKIQEPYILYFQEDMWLNKPINADFFNELFALNEKKKWNQVKLHSTGVYLTIPTSENIQGFNIAIIDNQKSDYLMSHQVTLWNKEFLIEQLHKNEHPWRNERKGTKRLKQLNPEILQIDYFAANGKAEVNNNPNPVKRGEYQTVSVNAVLNDNVLPFIEELRNDRCNEYADQLEYHYKNQITHDGKEKPRKVDIFKRLKNWIKGK